MQGWKKIRKASVILINSLINIHLNNYLKCTFIFGHSIKICIFDDLYKYSLFKHTVHVPGNLNDYSIPAYMKYTISYNIAESVIIEGFSLCIYMQD